MLKKQCLFSAPFDFLGDIKTKYNQIMPTEFKEIWHLNELQPDENLFAWVMNPGQRFTIDKSVLKNFPNLKVLVTPSTGTNHINKKDCQELGIPVFGLLENRPVLNSIKGSPEFTFMLLMNTLRRLDFAVNEVKAGRWRENEDDIRGFELHGKNVGLIGFGRIGNCLAKWCQAFEANVSYYDPYVKSDKAKKANSIEEIFKNNDIVCVCCVLTDETKGMINKSHLQLLKNQASFINTSRGEVLIENDLIETIQNRPDLRVAVDVLEGEVTNTHMTSELIKMAQAGKIIVTPHIAGATFESQTKAATGALELLQNYLKENY